jgi:dTDP-4-amino-4,6-dideoxygalactose transaminase
MTLTAPTGAARPPVQTPVAFAETYICQEAVHAVGQVLASGWVTTGRQVLEFEQEFAAYVGARRALAVSSCTAAIELALRALQLPAGSVVLVSTMTFCGAAHAIRHAGLVPFLVDVDPATGMPDARTTAEAAAACGGADAMLVVHLGGAPADVTALAAAAGLGLDRVVEDAAHALGTRVGEAVVGTLSRATCFSFYATKNLPIGEGGMVTTDDDELADRVASARLHGMSRDAWRRYLHGGGWRYDVEDAGIKANLTDVQAAIGRAQLRHFDAWQQHRADLAAQYDEALSQVPGIVLPSRPASGRHAWHLYAVRVLPGYGRTRDELIDLLRERGIGTSVHFIPLHRLSWFERTVGRPPLGCPGADLLHDQQVSLPLFQTLSPEAVRTVTRAVAELARPA